MVVIFFHASLEAGLSSEKSTTAMARVMMDTIDNNPKIEGAFRVSCLRETPDPISGSSKLFVENCKSVEIDGRGRNKHAAFRVKRSRLRVHQTPNSIQFRLESGRTLYEVVGKAFRFTGKFRWQGRPISKLDLLLRPERAQWVVHLPLDTYLAGVLGAEVPGSWPMAALKAQAVASRSYFLWKQDLKHRYFDVRSDHFDQVFQIRKTPSKKIVKAVRSTRGQYLMSRLTQGIFPAFFHSDCGGETASEHSVWRHPAAQNQPIPDRVCRTAKRNLWTRKVSETDLMVKLEEHFLLPRGVVLTHIIPRAPKGRRAHSVDFLFNGSLLKSMSADLFRKIMGFGKIKSTRFAVAKVKGHFEFKGRGYGHGVGMCQWGAKRWASLGQSYQQILAHYYPAAEIHSGEMKKPSSVANLRQDGAKTAF